LNRLANFSYRKIIKKLKNLGFSFHRQAAGSHEIGYNQAIRIGHQRDEEVLLRIY